MNDRFEELTEIWFKKAQEDLAWVKHDFKGKFYGMVCFGCQQIAEKSLKAYLFSRRQKLIRTHHLERLLEKCLKFNKEFLKIKTNCQILNQYYTDTRYPDIWDYTRFENQKTAQEAMVLAEQVLNFIKEKLKK